MLINEEFIPMLHYDIARTLSVKSTDAEAKRPCYLELLALYKALDRYDDRRDWRTNKNKQNIFVKFNGKHRVILVYSAYTVKYCKMYHIIQHKIFYINKLINIM